MLQGLLEGDVVDAARGLLGQRLIAQVRGEERRYHIVETEAYRGAEDLACHAARGRTARTEVMFGPAGRAYVYLIYGMYEMLNVVTGPEGFPAAVLIRAVAPEDAPDDVPRRVVTASGLDGPGKLTRALGITRGLNGHPLDAAPLRLEGGPGVPATRIRSTARVGVAYAGEWATRPWRFLVDGCAWVSRGRPSG